MKVLVLAAALVLSASAAQAASLKKWQTKALADIKAEKTVLDAKWRSPETNVLWVSMAADGSSRDGFADYLCMVLVDGGAP